MSLLCSSQILSQVLSRSIQLQAAPEDPTAPKIDDLGRSYGTGRRKTSVARVWIKEGSGQFIINDKKGIEYFHSMARIQCLEPFTVTETCGLFDVWCTAKGGGTSGMLLFPTMR